MNFEFSDDQRLLQEQVRQVFQETCPLAVARAALEGRAAFAEATWRKLGELGYLGVAIPEDFGGGGLGMLELCLVAEEAGRVLAPLPLLSSMYLASEALVRFGSSAQKKVHLPDLASGRKIATVSLSKAHGVDDAVRFERGRLHGAKLPVMDGMIAGLAIVRVEGPSLALVALDQAGVRREALETLDPTRPHARLVFDDAEAELLGAEGAGDAIATRLRDGAAILLGFEQLGGADAALELAREYALQRQAFGRVIASYQAIKHKLANVYVKNQIARGHCYFGAWALATEARELASAAAGVRIAATEAFRFAAQENVQTHGGIGFTWESDCHLFYRRARLYASALGAPRAWRERVVTAIEEGKGAESAATAGAPAPSASGAMSFEDTPEEASFRAEVRAWLAANAPRRSSDAAKGGGGLYDDAGVPEAKRWQAQKADAGYACLTWPKEFGGRGAKPIDEVIYSQEAAAYDLPESHFGIGLGMCIPILMTFGKPHHHERYVRPAIRGEEIWCQLFSEPAAGSDLAGIHTRATRDGDSWLLNGQKVWTSGAQYSDFGLILTRTDPDVPKHKGLTMFFLDMKSPGVEVRPIRQANGAKEFNEVFFTDVRVSDDQRLGAVGDGWKVAIATLMHERNSAAAGGGFVTAEQALAFARRLPRGEGTAAEDAAVREQIADWHVQEKGLRYTYYRALTALSKGETPGPEQSIHKVVLIPQAQQIAYFVMDLMDEAGILTSASLGPEWSQVEMSFWWGAALRIAGGSDEILRNIIAERVLGLPGDVRLDKDVPFSKIAGA